MSALKKALVAAAGAVASYYAVKLVTEMLEEKPLDARVRDARTRITDLKDTATAKYQDAADLMSSRVQALSDKVDSLLKEKSDKTGE